MNKGERQVAPTIEGIRVDHVARYEFVADREKGKTITDYAAGVGYGSFIMASSGNTISAIEIDEDAVSYAKKHYAANNIEYLKGDISTAAG